MPLHNRHSTLYFILAPIKQYVRLARHKSQWRKKNLHNLTQAKTIFPIDKVSVGNRTYGEIEYYHFGGESEGLQIGNFCSIAGSVKFLGGGEHPANKLSTFPFLRHVYGMTALEDIKGKIIVEDDVWICDGCTILSGVTIGQGAIIGANSIVTKDVPPYGIWIGSELKKYRFCTEICHKLTALDYSRINLTKFQDCCDRVIDNDNVDEILRAINE